MENDVTDILHNGGLENLDDYKIFRRRYPSRTSIPNRMISEWYLQEIPYTERKHSKWVCLIGIYKDTIIRTSPITSIISKNKVCTCNCIYTLLNPSKVLEHPFLDIENKFIDGFPENWEDIIEEAFEKSAKNENVTKKIQPLFSADPELVSEINAVGCSPIIDQHKNMIDVLNDNIFNDKVEIGNEIKLNDNTKLDNEIKLDKKIKINDEVDDNINFTNNCNTINHNSMLGNESLVKNDNILISDYENLAAFFKTENVDNNTMQNNKISGDSARKLEDSSSLNQSSFCKDIIEVCKNSSFSSTTIDSCKFVSKNENKNDDVKLKNITPTDRKVIDDINSVLKFSKQNNLDKNIIEKFSIYDENLFKEKMQPVEKPAKQRPRNSKRLTVEEYVEKNSPFKAPSRVSLDSSFGNNRSADSSFAYNFENNNLNSSARRSIERSADSIFTCNSQSNILNDSHGKSVDGPVVNKTEDLILQINKMHENTQDHPNIQITKEIDNSFDKINETKTQLQDSDEIIKKRSFDVNEVNLASIISDPDESFEKVKRFFVNKPLESSEMFKSKIEDNSTNNCEKETHDFRKIETITLNEPVSDNQSFKEAESSPSQKINDFSDLSLIENCNESLLEVENIDNSLSESNVRSTESQQIKKHMKKLKSFSSLPKKSSTKKDSIHLNASGIKSIDDSNDTLRKRSSIRISIKPSTHTSNDTSNKKHQSFGDESFDSFLNKEVNSCSFENQSIPDKNDNLNDMFMKMRKSISNNNVNENVVIALENPVKKIQSEGSTCIDLDDTVISNLNFINNEPIRSNSFNKQTVQENNSFANSFNKQTAQENNSFDFRKLNSDDTHVNANMPLNSKESQHDTDESFSEQPDNENDPKDELSSSNKSVFVELPMKTVSSLESISQSKSIQKPKKKKISRLVMPKKLKTHTGKTLKK